MKFSGELAKIKRPQLGHLDMGAEADVAVLRLEKGSFGFIDSAGAGESRDPEAGGGDDGAQGARGVGPEREGGAGVEYVPVSEDELPQVMELLLGIAEKTLASGVY